MKSKKELYEKGYFFIRKKHLNPKCRLNIIADEWAIYVSREHGSWKLLEKFYTEMECDVAIQGIIDEYDNVIVE